MALLNLLFDDAVRRPINLFDQNFGLGILNDDLYQPIVLGTGYCRPWRHLTRQQSGTSSLTKGKEGFKVTLDVQQFKPEEVSVKTVDNTVVIEGKHEERADEHGFVSRHFIRKYTLPETVESDKVECKLSSDGVLSITAPPKPKEPEPENSRSIPITQTGVPAVKATETEKKEESEEKA